MNKIITDNTTNLTPETAKSKGYMYIDDIIIDYNKFGMEDIVKLIQQYNFKIGSASAQNNIHSYFGLYAPVNSA